MRSQIRTWLAAHLDLVVSVTLGVVVGSLIFTLVVFGKEVHDKGVAANDANANASQASSAAAVAQQNNQELRGVVTCIEGWANQFTDRSDAVSPALTAALLDLSQLLSTVAKQPDNQVLIRSQFATTNKAFQSYATATHMHAVPTLQSLHCEQQLDPHPTATKTVGVPGPTVVVPGPTVVRTARATVTVPPGHRK